MQSSDVPERSIEIFPATELSGPKAVCKPVRSISDAFDSIETDTEGKMMTFPRFIVLAALALGLTITVSPATMAQTAPPPAQREAPAQGAVNVTQEDLKSYAVAALQVQKINQTYQPAIQNAKTADEQKQLHEQAMQEMMEAVKEEGLSIDKYNQITQAVETNPEIKQQVQGYMGQAQQSAPPPAQ